MTTLCFVSQVTTGDHLTLEADAVGHPTAVYDLLACVRFLRRFRELGGVRAPFPVAAPGTSARTDHPSGVPVDSA